MKTIRLISAVLLLISIVLLGGLSQSASASSQPSKGQQPADTVQHFQDVPVGSFWYNYTAILFNAGITSGFPCGAPPAGACVPPANLPYYNPNDNVTRGQMSKFIGLAISPGTIITGSYGFGNSHPGAVNIYNTASDGTGLYSSAPTAVEGDASATGGLAGYFYSTGNSGTGVVAAGGGAVQIPGSGIGLLVGGRNTSGTSYAIYSTLPSGDSNFTLQGSAHIHGSNISAASYEVEVRYDDTTAAQMGDVLVADGSSETADGTTVLGVVKATPDNAALAVGVLSKRLTTEQSKGVTRTGMDANATAIQPGDHAYATVVGTVRMKVGKASMGDRLTVAASGLTTTGSADSAVGKVISQPDKDGYALVFVNVK